MDENQAGSSSTNKISPLLKPIMERFPNLSQETLEKLSTPEGLRNRHKIVASLSEDELKSAATSVGLGLSPLKELSHLHGDEKIPLSKLKINDKIKVEKLLDETTHLNSEEVIKLIHSKFPYLNLNLDIDSYRNEFMRAVEAEIASGKTQEERDNSKRAYLKVDLKEIQRTVGTSDIKSIRNVLRENYTHNSLLNEIKKGRKEVEDLSDADILNLKMKLKI
jgi:hypothetical protein